MMPDRCPHCAASLIDPENSALRLDMLHEIRGVHDGALYTSCPVCRGAWHSWKPEHGRRYEIAESYVAAANYHAGITP